MSRRLARLGVAALSVFALAGTAVAGEMYTKDNWPSELAKRTLVLPKGLCEIYVPLDLDVSSGDYDKPISLAPDIWYGVNDKLTIGLTHENGIVLKKEFEGQKTYDDVGVMAKHCLALGSSSELALNVGLVAMQLSDPMYLSAIAGFDAKWWNRTGTVALWANPVVCFAVNNRDEVMFDQESDSYTGGNEDLLKVPASVIFQATPKLAVGIETGIFGPLDGFGDDNDIPVGALLLLNTHQKMDVGARFAFDDLLGKDHTTDYRSLFLFANFRP